MYETEADGRRSLGQRDFLNAVARDRDDRWTPLELLDACKRIERELGREPGPRHGPRPIDVDVLLVGDEVLHAERLRAAPSGGHQPALRARAPARAGPASAAEELRAALAALPPGQRVERVGELIP